MNNLIIKNSQLVQAVVTNATPAYGQTYFFQDIPNISKGNIALYGIEAYSATQMATSPTGNTVISQANCIGLSVSLVTTKNNFKQIEDQPYYNFIRSVNSGFVVLLNAIRIDLTKCYITILNAGTIAQNQVALFNLYYSLLPEGK